MSSSDELLTVESFLFICQKIDLSIDDLDHMNIGGCLDLMQEWIDNYKDQNERKEESTRKATQADFDSF